MVWRAGELLYFVAIWWYLAGLENPNKGLPAGWYSVAIWVHVIATLWFASLLIRDALKPSADPVRVSTGTDPQGGVLNVPRYAARAASGTT